MSSCATCGHDRDEHGYRVRNHHVEDCSVPGCDCEAFVEPEPEPTL